MIEALNYFILCKKVGKEETKSPGGIILSDTAESNQPNYLVVKAPISVNEGQGHTRPCMVKEGDVVLMQGREVMLANIKLDDSLVGTQLHVFQEHQVVCILRRE